MANIFENINFLDGHISSSSQSSSVEIPSIHAVYDEGTIIRNCDCFITENMVEECFGNADLIRQSAILEGAKIDWKLKNWLREGKDYKGLKKEVKEIIKANDLDDSDLRGNGRKFMHICKRILQICEDIGIAIGAGTAIGQMATGLAVSAVSPIIGVSYIVGTIVGFVIGFIINRLFRYLWDTLEFNNMKEDAENIVSDLRRNARKAENKKMADKFNSEADRLEAAIKKYSKKSKDND